MKAQLFTLVAAAVLAPTLAFADSVTSTVETTSDTNGYYMSRPMSNMAAPSVIREEGYDERGDRVIVRDTATVVTDRYKTKFGSDTGFDANSPSPKARIIRDKEVETTTRVIR